MLWGAFGLYVLMILYRIARFAAMPLHLRWELYPLALEPKHAHGGSYMEEVDYVQRPRRHFKLNGLLELASEVLLLTKVRKHNRYGIWPFSLAMHWGTYLLFGWCLLLLVEAIPGLAFLAPVTNGIGVIAWVLGAAGCLGLLLTRATVQELAIYTAPVDYFNLLFMWAIFATGLTGWLTGPGFFTAAREWIRGGSPAGAGAVWAWLHFGLFALFLLYMPFSKILHYVGKYFTIDKILWDDELNTRGSATDRRIQTQLGTTLTWAGPHIVPGKSWAEEAAIPDAREGK